jgi:peptidoglycan hydrolase-like protein with peptidoglycan-binding domain
MALMQSLGIVASVGAQPGATNSPADVKNVQKLLNEHASRVGFAPLSVTGTPTPQMIDAIRAFQKKVVGMNHPDGRVDPKGKTITALNTPAGPALPPPQPRRPRRPSRSSPIRPSRRSAGGRST